MALQVYWYAQNHDNIGGLAQVSVQPRSNGIQFPQKIHTLSGDLHYNGTPYFVWLYAALTYAEMATLFTEFGLTSSVTAPVTAVECTVWTAVGEDYESDPTAGFLNAVLLRPDLAGKAHGHYYRNVEFMFTDVAEAS